jgi:hypothetical protein
MNEIIYFDICALILIVGILLAQSQILWDNGFLI